VTARKLNPAKIVKGAVIRVAEGADIARPKRGYTVTITSNPSFHRRSDFGNDTVFHDVVGFAGFIRHKGGRPEKEKIQCSVRLDGIVIVQEAL
jgi:hypothetical protein